MRFLADESCDFSVVRALRSAKHDVVAIAEVSPRADDDDVRERAVNDERILITGGQGLRSAGLCEYAENRRGYFIRFPARARRQLADAVVDLVRQRSQRLVGNFTVIQPGRVRTGRNPKG